MVIKWNVTIPKLSGEKPRRAYIYLPASYEKEPKKRYPVMYMFQDLPKVASSSKKTLCPSNIYITGYFLAGSFSWESGR